MAPRSGSEIRPGPALLLTAHYLPMRPNGVGRVGWKGCTPREQTANLTRSVGGGGGVGGGALCVSPEVCVGGAV